MEGKEEGEGEEEGDFGALVFSFWHSCSDART